MQYVEAVMAWLILLVWGNDSRPRGEQVCTGLREQFRDSNVVGKGLVSWEAASPVLQWGGILEILSCRRQMQKWPSGPFAGNGGFQRRFPINVMLCTHNY